jgi:hypothetical protein
MPFEAISSDFRRLAWIALYLTTAMAKTNKIARYVKEMPALERSANRSTPSKAPVLYLVELRSHHAEAQSPVPKRKLVISTDPRDDADAPARQIKIHHT